MTQNPNDRQWRFDSEIGPLFLIASDAALHAVLWREANVPHVRSPDEHPVLRETVSQLDQYFAGDRQTFDLPLVARGGTAFQREVWAALARIPFGQTWSYRALAREVGRERAVRAVGSANGQNPLSIVVPCHRVIAADGSLGGFIGGLIAKSRLLEIERAGCDAACLPTTAKLKLRPSILSGGPP